MNNKKTIYAVCLLLLVTVMTIGYALISGTLNINGNAKITAASWEIYFKNVEIKDGSVEATQDPTITDKTSLSYNIKLKKPGDYFEFNVDVVNNGMLDAMIDKITILPDISDKPYLSYSVKYLDDSNVEEKDILHSKKARTIKVRVEYLKNIDNNELNSSEQTLNMSFEMKYVQADATAKIPTAADKNASPWVVINGDGTNVGDEIAIGDEHFYVISNDGTNITMFAKYNLNINDLNYKQNINNTISPVTFSSTNYWYNGSSLKIEYGASYPAYVYDNSSSISNYINNYKYYLESLEVYVEDVRLISYNELVSLGCNSSICSSAPSWVWSTSYWSGSAYNWNSIWTVFSNGTMYNGVWYANDDGLGVRPVIVISSNAI